MRKMVKRGGWAWILVFLMVAACGSDKYGEVEKIITEQAQVTENYVNGLEKAQSADDVVAVIDEFSDGLKSLIPKIKEYHQKFPELWNKNGGIPKEIQDQQKRLEAASAKIQSATMNLMKYMMDPKVQEAMSRMNQEMSQMQ